MRTRTKRSFSAPVSPTRAGGRRWRFGPQRLATGLAVTLLLVSGGYLTVFFARAAMGVSRVEAAPSTVRLQVVMPEAYVSAQRRSGLLERLEQWQAEGMAVEVVETQVLDSRSIEHTLVVSRQEDLTAARQLARRLGLDEEQVWYEPLPFNRRMVAVTLFVGEDFDIERVNAPTQAES